MKKQFESENDTICRQKLEAATKKITRNQRYDLFYQIVAVVEKKLLFH